MKSMDLFLIGGQSNAVGYSPVSGDKTIETNRIFEGFWYAGEGDVFLNGEAAEKENTNGSLKEFVKGVGTGLGRNPLCIGPEYGFAEALSRRYGAENPAFLFKTAAGGVSIFDTDEGYSGVYGNWCPPSERPPLEARTAACGAVYDRFMGNFESVYRRLTEQNLSPRVRAVLWLQGETDRSKPEEYKKYLKALIGDMRKDLGEITGSNTSHLAFIINGISPTVFSFDTKYKNDKFNEMLKGVAAKEKNVYFVDNAADEFMWVNDCNNKAIGADRCHFNAVQMRELGKRFADVVINNVLNV